jgi:hypothetical protein
MDDELKARVRVSVYTSCEFKEGGRVSHTPAQMSWHTWTQMAIS